MKGRKPAKGGKPAKGAEPASKKPEPGKGVTVIEPCITANSKTLLGKNKQQKEYISAQTPGRYRHVWMKPCLSRSKYVVCQVVLCPRGFICSSCLRGHLRPPAGSNGRGRAFFETSR